MSSAFFEQARAKASRQSAANSATKKRARFDRMSDSSSKGLWTYDSAKLSRRETARASRERRGLPPTLARTRASRPRAPRDLNPPPAPRRAAARALPVRLQVLPVRGRGRARLAAGAVSGDGRGRRAARRGRAGRHGRAGAGLLFGRQRQEVADEQSRVVFVVVVGRGRERAVEDPALALVLEQLRGHGRAGHDALRVEQPAESPVGLQARAGLQEVGRGRRLVVRRVARHVALQTGRGLRREQSARQVALALRQRLKLLLDVRLLLRRDGLEEADECAQLVRREAERGHTHAQVRADAVAVLARLRLECARRVRTLLAVRALLSVRALL